MLVGKTVIALMAPLTALGLWAAGRRFFSPVAGLVAAIVYVSIPWVVQVSTAGLVDMATGGYRFLAVYAVMLGTATGGPRGTATSGAIGTATNGRSFTMAVLAGYLAGAAVACKYPAVVFVAIPLFLWIVAASVWQGSDPTRFASGRLLHPGRGRRLWAVVRQELGACRQPDVPAHVFRLRRQDLGRREEPPVERRPRAAAVLALRDGLGRGPSDDDQRVAQPAGHAAGSWRYLALPASAAARLVLAGYFAVVVAVWWLFTHRLDRFWIPALPIAALLAGAGACWSTDRPWRWTLRLLLVLGTLYCFLTAASVGGGYTRYFVRLSHARTDPDCVGPGHRYLNRTIRQDRILLVGDAQPFDLQMPVLYNTCFDDSIFEQLVKDRSPANPGGLRRAGHPLGLRGLVRGRSLSADLWDDQASSSPAFLSNSSATASLDRDRGLASDGGVPPKDAELYRVEGPAARP